MIRIYLLALIIAAFFWFKGLLKKSNAERKLYIRKSALYTLVPVVVLLAATGRLNWVIAALGVIAASVARFLPLALRYAPQLQRLWASYRTGGNNGKQQSQYFSAASGTMTVEEASKILAVPMTATDKEIIDAHRRIILKNHPDRGGSSYLAAQINRAKEVLLEYKQAGNK